MEYYEFIIFNCVNLPIKKLEREKERKKRIAEKLAAGKDVGNNKREKGKTVFIEQYMGPDGEVVLETPEMQADYSPPKVTTL